MSARNLSRLDRIISSVDEALRTAVPPQARLTRASPAGDLEDADLSPGERRHAAGLMRVNHAGEIAAQGLYQGHAAVAHDAGTRQQMQQAAQEELDHLGWCEQRLDELGDAPSRLCPLWYAGSFAIGVASGILGDRWSLGFVEETEKQVADHLSSHLERLPERDVRSRAIVERMRQEEEEHGARARKAGAAELPQPVRDLMRVTARVMTATAYRL